MVQRFVFTAWVLFSVQELHTRLDLKFFGFGLWIVAHGIPSWYMNAAAIMCTELH